ncbi:TVP38/TMEM64 family protein [Nitrospira sp. M1]
MSLVLTTDPKKKVLYIIVFFVLLYLIVEATGLRSKLSPETIKDLFLEHTFWGLVVFCVAFSIGNLLYVPGWVFLVGAVFALGKEWGGVATISAAMCSATVSFLLIRAVGGSALRSFNNKWADRIFSQLDERPILSVTLLRILFQTLPALNYALALADIRFRHYMLGTILGLPLPIFLYCYFFEVIFQHLLKG